MSRGLGRASLAAATLLLLTSCGRTSAPAPDAGPAPVARHPVLDACPGAGSASQLPEARLGCFTGGPAVDPAALGGSPTLVNLWASWCGPCQREMPALQRAYHRYGTQLRFLGVDTTDDKDSADDFLATIGVHYPQARDTPGDLLHRVGGPGLPVTLVLDAAGAVVYRHRGQLRPTDLTAALEAAGIMTPAADNGLMGEHHTS